MTTKKEISAFIRREVENFIDDCGEINCTLAAETACDHFDGYVDHVGYEIPEVYFDAAVEEAEAFEKAEARKAVEARDAIEQERFNGLAIVECATEDAAVFADYDEAREIGWHMTFKKTPTHTLFGVEPNPHGAGYIVEIRSAGMLRGFVSKKGIAS